MSININLLGEQFQEIMKQHSERMKRIAGPLLNLQKLPVFEELQKNMQAVSRLTEGVALKNKEAFERIADLHNHSGLKALSEQIELMNKDLTAKLSINFVGPILKDLQSSINGLEISEDKFVRALEKLEKRDFVEEFENTVSNIEKGHSTAQGISVGVSEVLAFLMFILMLIQTIDDSTDRALKELSDKRDHTNSLLQRLVELNSSSEELINKSKDESLKLLIANESVPLRSQPRIEADTLITLFKGQHLDLLEAEDNWYKVQYHDFSVSKNGVGWVQKKHIIPRVNGGQVQTKKLGDIATSSKGKKPDLIENKPRKNLIPYVDIQGFEERIFRKYTDGKDCRLCKEGDLLIVWDGSRSGLVGKAPAGAIGSTLAKIEIDGVTNDYGYYFLKSHYQYLNTNPKGSGTPHVDPNLLWNLDIRIPSIDEQQRIVEKIEELFSDLDNGIENLKKAKQQLETYKQSVLKAAFEGKLTKEWREQQDELSTPEELKEQIEKERKKYREQQLKEWEEKVEEWKEQGEPGRKPRKPRKIRSTSPIKEDDVDDKQSLPNKWSWTRVGDIGKVGTGSTPLKKKHELYYEGGEIPWVTSGALNDWYVEEASGFVTKKALEETNLTVYPKHTLLVAMYGEGKTRGKCSELLIEACTNQAVAAIVQENTEAKTRQFLKYFFLKNYNDIRRLSAGGVQPNLNLGIIRDTLVPLPPLKEQEEIVEKLESRLSVVQQMEKTITAELQKAKALRQSILKKAFAGRLVKEESVKEQFQKPQKKYYKNTATDLHAGIMSKIIDAHYQEKKHLKKLNHVKCE